MSLQELVAQANRIIVGTVQSVDTRAMELADGTASTTAQVREVVLRVDQALKGDVTAGQTLTVRQLWSLSSPVTAGETVMWYLPQDSSLGLTQPLGVFSGDFRVDPETKQATNLRQNEGLWADSLWTGDGFDRASVLSEASASMKLTAAARTTIDSAAVRPPTAAGVPLNLLVSATLSHVKQQ